MNFKGFVLTLGCFVASLSAATNYNIHGIVSSAKDEKPIQGAVVTLLQHNAADTTDTDGAFLLQSVEVASEDSSAISADSSAKNDQNVQVIRTSLSREFQSQDAGWNQFFNINGRQISGNRFTKNYNIYFVRNPSKNMGKVLRKEASSADGIFDTLRVEANGHISKKIALSSNTQELNIKLDTIVTETPKDTNVTEPAKETKPALIADGYASLNGGTTGGAGGDTVVVSTYAAFKAAIQTDKPKVVIVKGTIKTTDGDGYGLGIYSNTTIMGADSSATIYGGLTVNGKKNVIIYNINIHGTYPNPGPSDGIAVSHGATNVWIHHVNIWDAEDGNLDITTQASYVTVSYVHFWYTDANHPHRLNALIGSGASNHPEDFNKLKVTYHHCWFGTLVNERMPRVMYGNAHIYNNYYTATDNLYGVGVGSYGSALIENNYFYKTHNPIIFMYNVYAYVNTKNNVYDNVTTSSNSSTTPVVANNGGKIYGERYITTDPYTLLEDPAKLDKVPYEYALDKAADVPNIVKKQVGPHNY